jgi:hypothetical protein
MQPACKNIDAINDSQRAHVAIDSPQPSRIKFVPALSPF